MRKTRPVGRRGAALAAWGFVLLAAFVFARGLFRRAGRTLPLSERVLPRVTPPAQEVAPLRFVTPTAQTRLADTDSPEVYMPTASGRIESALYGSTRTRLVGGRARASFHEGIDIAPMRRDRQGRPLDEVRAAADGRVSHVNAHAGESNYGLYVVLRHTDPVGEIYTLYAHLASVRPGLAPGAAVSAGETLGVMGHTGGQIPRARAHLHFEIGVIANGGFAAWHRAQRLKPDHGADHGWNLWGLDPLAVYVGSDPGEGISLLDLLQRMPTAFVLALPGAPPVDYLRRHPALWLSGLPPQEVKGVLLNVCEGGLVLRARPMTEDERSREDAVRIVSVCEDTLGRNGRGLIARGPDSDWQLTSAGRQWLEILLYPAPLP